MLDFPFIKEIASGVAFILTLLLFVPYILSIKRKEIVPHYFSWTIWAFGTLVVFFAQLSDGGGIGAWPIGFSACITCYVAFLSYRVRSKIEITVQDRILFGLAVSAIPAWVIASDPIWAVVFLTLADLLGFGPTLRKAYSRPYEEHVGVFALAGVRNALVVVALEHYSWTTVLFPAAVGIGCLLVAAVVFLRRYAIPQKDSTGKRGAINDDA